MAKVAARPMTRGGRHPAAEEGAARLAAAEEDELAASLPKNGEVTAVLLNKGDRRAAADVRPRRTAPPCPDRRSRRGAPSLPLPPRRVSRAERPRRRRIRRHRADRKSVV